MRSQIQVVAAIIEINERFLFGKRADYKESAPGYWCPVTGTMESGETEEQTVTREVAEEVGLRVVPTRKLAEIDSYDGIRKLHYWLVAIIDGVAYLKNDEHSELGWFTADELEDLSPAFPQDIEIHRQVVQDLRSSSLRDD